MLRGLVGRPRRARRTGRGKLTSVLAVRNYRLYFIGQNVSVAGNWMQNVALGWYVFDETGSGTALGTVTGIRFAPVLLLAMWGGLLSDRLDKRKILVATNLAVAAASAAFAVLVALDAASVVTACVLAFTLGCLTAVQQPAQQSFIVEMVPADLVPNAIALNSTMVNMARIIGPSIAGVLLATVGASWCFALNAASSVVVVATLLAINRRQLVASPPVARSKGQLREGLRYIWRTPGLRVPLLATVVAGTFAWEFQVTLPMMASDAFDLGASAYGAMLSALGVGAVAGGLLIASRSSFSPRSVGWAAAGWGVAIVAAALAPSFHWALLALCAVGYGTLAFNSGTKTMVQLTSRPDMRGRVMGVWLIAWQGTTVVGGPAIGWIGETFGARWALGAGGAALLLAAAFVMPSMRRMPLPEVVPTTT